MHFRLSWLLELVPRVPRIPLDEVNDPGQQDSGSLAYTRQVLFIHYLFLNYLHRE